MNGISIFVYGTLLAGESNHRLLTASRRVAEARTRPAYTLRDLGGCPALVAGGCCVVLGELYEVDEPVLAALDRLEGHPRFYRRSRLVLADNRFAWAYLLREEQVTGTPIIASGSWRLRQAARKEHRV